MKIGKIVLWICGIGIAIFAFKWIKDKYFPDILPSLPTPDEIIDQVYDTYDKVARSADDVLSNYVEFRVDTAKTVTKAASNGIKEVQKFGHNVKKESAKIVKNTSKTIKKIFRL